MTTQRDPSQSHRDRQEGAAAPPSNPAGRLPARGVPGPVVAVLAVALLAAGFALGRLSGAPATLSADRAPGAAGLSVVAPGLATAHGGGAAASVTDLRDAGAFAWVQAQVPQLQAPGNPQELVPLPGGRGGLQGQGQNQGQGPGQGPGQGQGQGQNQGQAQGNCLQLFMFRDGRMFQFSPGQQGNPGAQASPFGGQGNPFGGQGNPLGRGGGPQELYPLQPVPSPGRPSPGTPGPRAPSPFSPPAPQAPLAPPGLTQGPSAPSRSDHRGEATSTGGPGNRAHPTAAETAA